MTELNGNGAFFRHVNCLDGAFQLRGHVHLPHTERDIHRCLMRQHLSVGSAG